MLFLTRYFPDHSSFGIGTFNLAGLGQPITRFIYFSLFGWQHRKQAGKGIDANVFVVLGEAESSALKSEAVSDLVSVADTLDSLDSDGKRLHKARKMHKCGFNLNVSCVDLFKTT